MDQGALISRTIPGAFWPFAISLPNFFIHIITAFFIFSLLKAKFRCALREIPGPALAKYTRLWKLYSVWKGNHHETEIALHRKYGNLVRIGPNHISIADISAVPIIYGVNNGFTKTAFYPIQSILMNQKPLENLFSTRDESYHRNQKRHIAGAYSMSSLLELESMVDSCTDLFMTRLRHFSSQNIPLDLGAWLQYYAFDVVGELTFAKKLGFLEQGGDVEGMMATIQSILLYSSVCGQVPELHSLLLGNPILPLLIPMMEEWNQVVGFTRKAIASQSRDGANPNGKDMLSKWNSIHQKSSEKLSQQDIVVHLSTNVFAGSDTTAIALRSVFYNLMRDQRVMSKVQVEIDEAGRAGNLSDPISYKESITHLPYLSAVLKEAMRVHPSVGLIMEREVPKGGVSICGKHIPGRTIVGINPWVLHRDSSIYSDPDSFIPERWIDNSPDVLKKMEQGFLNFGGGSRTCIGRHIPLMEMHKIIPQLLREFEIRLHSPEKEWRTKNVWFVQQEGLVCDLTRRS